MLSHGLMQHESSRTNRPNPPRPSRVRGEPRQPAQATAEIAAVDGVLTDPDAPRQATVLDESASGLCLQLTEPVPVGATLSVTVREPGGEVARSEIARVSWCRPREGGRYNAGLAIHGETLCVAYQQQQTEIDVRPRS